MPRNSVIVIIVLLMFGGFNHVAYAATETDTAKQAPPASYSFNPAGKPDPFRPFVEKDPVLLNKKAETVAAVSIFPLQKVGLDQFNLIGIASDSERRLAVVETKDSKGSRFYALTLGTVIGLNKGKVVEIKNDLFVVEEVISLRSGKKPNRIIKKLRKDEEGIP
jgi:type IV pilus assembly protein PilP